MACACCSGIITSSQMFSSGYGGAVFAGILMLMIGLVFGALAALDAFMLLRVSRDRSSLKDLFHNIYPKRIISFVHAIGLTNKL